MNYYEVTNLVDQNKKLNFAQKAILRKIIGFNLNNHPFFATNQYLADYFGCDIATIKRSIAVLKTLGFITVSVERKKHSTGDTTWYNKRYITPNYEVITGIEIIHEQPQILTLEKAVDPLEPIQEVSSENDYNDEPVNGVFPEQDTAYTRMFAEAAAKPSCKTEFSPIRTVKMINQETFLQDVFNKKYPDFQQGQEITDELKDYLQGFFNSGIKGNQRLLEKYEAILA